MKYFTWNTNQWASFEDEQTLQQKIHYANSVGLGGIFTWAVDMDDSNLDELRGMIYPAQLQANNNTGLSYWDNINPGSCFTSSCGSSCPVGNIRMTDMPCPSGGESRATLCCPLQSAPDPSTCQWRDGDIGGLSNVFFCNGQCQPGEVTLATSSDGDGDEYCISGVQVYCCPIPEVASGGGIACEWTEECSAKQVLMTFAGTFLEYVDLASLAKLSGVPLAVALGQLDYSNGL